MKFLKRMLVLIAGGSTCFIARADVKPASPFGNHMVLQRNVPVPVWGTASPGEKITVSFMKQKKEAIASADGKWTVNLDKLSAGGPYVLSITGNNSVSFSDVYAGEVWICSGQSNMDMTVAKENQYWCGVFGEAEELAAANYPLIRVMDVDFTPSIPVQTEIKTKGWELVSPATVGHMSAAAYFFARDVQKKIKVPIGLIVTSYGASTAEAWIRKPALEADPRFEKFLSSFKAKIERYADTAVHNKYRRDTALYNAEVLKAKAEGKTPPRAPARLQNPERDQHNPYVLWNGMVSALVPYAIRGALWYQGESNGPTVYTELMNTLITDWRKQWGQGDFPFLYVQIANIGKAYDSIPGGGGDRAKVRDAQLKNLATPNTAMIVAIDNADPNDMNNVHPKNKQEIGRRLAAAGLALAYNEKITYSGPVYDRMEVAGNVVKLYFKHIGSGLMFKGEKPEGFAIAGADKKFVWADVKIEGDHLLVSAPGISNPVAVRYAFSSNPKTSLYNKENFPASPFKTDDF